MATPVGACGFECGVIGLANNTAHLLDAVGTYSISTTTVRSGSRSFRSNPTALTGRITTGAAWYSGDRHIGRIYVRFASLPTADTMLISQTSADDGPGVRFKNSDSKIYAAVGTTFGATGIAVTTGIWYRIDYDFNLQTAGSDFCDVQVDGTACGQATAAGTASGSNFDRIGIGSTCTADVFFDDWVVSGTAADYPLGAGYVLSYIPSADGTHNVAGANDFERSLTGVDITNGTSDAFDLVNDQPLPTTEVDFINGIGPPNSTDYVEVDYESSAEPGAPRAVEAIFIHHDAGGAGTNNFTVTLRDNDGATSANIFSGTTNVGATITAKRAHFSTIPGGGAWTLAAFNAMRSRFLVADASPDVYLDALMLEAEYASKASLVIPRSADRKVLLRR